MSKLFLILGLVFTFGVTGARANLYYDQDFHNVVLSPTRTTQYGTFNIAVQGYNPSAESLVWAGFAFTFLGYDDREETVRISLGHEVSSYHHIARGFNLFGGLLAGDALLDLSADGIISYQVRWVSGDPFRLLTASLLAESASNVSTPSTSVPDGGTTLCLLGVGLLALGCARKRLKSAPTH